MLEGIARDASSPQFRKQLTQLLLDLCRVDTTPRADVASLRTAELTVFDRIEAEVKGLGLPGLRLERRPIDPAIGKHPFFSNLYYTRSSERPQGLGVEETYRGRCNLLAIVSPSPGTPGEGSGGGGASNAECRMQNAELDAPHSNPPPEYRERGQRLALNAHVDVVKPYVPPRIEGDTLFGRGSCDDKGPLVAIVGALRLVAAALRGAGRTLNRDLLAMFVIEEEMGGNGSLSAAIDRDLRRHYDTMHVLECTSSVIHPGNRGAVWYRLEAKLPGANLFEASALIIDEMEREGRAIRAESAHELFPHRPVQTCHGILGGFGDHPSRICGRVDFAVRFKEGSGFGVQGSGTKSLVRDVIADALAQYTGVYGDKTKVIDERTGRPKVDHHYDLVESPDGFVVQVHGSTGHMGSILQNDGAITKAAAIVRSLVASRAAIERTAGGGSVSFDLVNWPDRSHLLMEGGQGFLPTHAMADVQRRLQEAAWRGAERYLRACSRPDDVRPLFVMTFEKLHNAAFAGDPDSAAMHDAIAAARAAGIWDEGHPVRGWDVSCDARIFACEYPGEVTVLTGGPGHLVHAHADDEQVSIDDVVKFAHYLARFILTHTGTIGMVA